MQTEILAIEWESWMDDPTLPPVLISTKQEDLVWIDEITNSTYFIKESRYDDLINQLYLVLQKSSGEVCYKQIWGHTHIPFGKCKDLELAIHLPFPKPKMSQDIDSIDSPVYKRTRLVDHVLLRAGLYYAINHPSQNEWELIRKDLLQIECAFTDEIDSFLINGVWNGEDQEVDIVKAGAVKIKQYFLETNNIQEIRGASVLLDEINQKRIIGMCKENWTPEIIVYSGGGNILIVTPKGEGQRCAEEIERMFSEITVSAQAVAQAATVSLAQLNRIHFEDTLGWLEMKKTERQMTVLPPNELPLKPNLNLYREKEMEPYLNITPAFDGSETIINTFQKTINNETICTLCNKHIVQVKISPYKGETKLVCQSCLNKIISGRNTDIFIEDMNNVLKRFQNDFKINSFSESLGDLVQDFQSDYIALIYGDGNNMGGVVEKLSSFQAFRYFSQLTDSITKLVVYTSLIEIMKGRVSDKNQEANFEIIAVGGDDVFLVVPGEFGLKIARVLGEKFDRAFRKYGQEEHETMTMSVGVAFGKSKTPFVSLFQTASELLKSAKELKKKGKNLEGGTLDFMKVKTSTSFPGQLNTFRKTYLKRTEMVLQEKVQLQQYLRPFTWKQVKVLEDFLENTKKSNQSGRSILYKLRDVCETMTIQEAKLFYLYFICSKSSNSSTGRDREIFRINMANFAKEFSHLKQADLFLLDETQNIYYSPYYDFVEVWDI